MLTCFLKWDYRAIRMNLLCTLYHLLCSVVPPGLYIHLELLLLGRNQCSAGNPLFHRDGDYKIAFPIDPGETDLIHRHFMLG